MSRSPLHRRHQQLAAFDNSEQPAAYQQVLQVDLLGFGLCARQCLDLPCMLTRNLLTLCCSSSGCPTRARSTCRCWSRARREVPVRPGGFDGGIFTLQMTRSTAAQTSPSSGRLRVLCDHVLVVLAVLVEDVCQPPDQFRRFLAVDECRSLSHRETGRVAVSRSVASSVQKLAHGVRS